MRFRRLGLTAFGPFSGAELVFGPPGGVDIVFGPNEAGKSTALRAVRGFLFGIPENGDDAHRHPASELCLEGELESSDEAPRAFRRRRRRKDSLRDLADAPVDEAMLARWMGGIDAAAFERLFAVDHARLAQAAEDMLRGKGDVGEALFDAGSGGTAVGRLIAKLDEEAAELFSPLARTKPLNRSIKAFREARQEAKRAATPAQAYLDQRARLERVRGEIDALGLERRSLAAEHAKLVRIERALPPLGRCRSAREGLAALGPVVPLPEGAPARRARAEELRAASRAEAEHLEREVAERQKRLDRALPASPLAELSEDALLGLLAQLKRLVEGRAALPERREQLARLDARIVELSARLGFAGEMERTLALRVRGADLGRARKLIAERAVSSEARAHLAKRRGELGARLLELRSGPAAPDAGAYAVLESAIESARGAAELEPRRLAERDKVERLSAELRLAGARLVPVPRAGVPLGELKVPSDESLERLALLTSELDAERVRLTERAARAREAAALADREIARISGAGSLPSEAELEAARSERDRALAEVSRAAAAGQAVAAAVASALGEGVARADELADRLRREATRVGELAGQRAELAARNAELSALERASEDNEHRRAEVRRELVELFRDAAVEPLPAQEMRAWLKAQHRAAGLGVELAAAEHGLRALERDAARLARPLRALLGPELSDDADPSACLRVAERRAESERVRKRAHDEAQRAAAQAESELAAIDAELGAHDDKVASGARELEARLRALGLPADGAGEAGERLDGLVELSEQLDARANLAAGLDEHAARETSFGDELTGLLRGCAPELLTLPAEAALRTLLERQREALAEARERKSVTRELLELEGRLAEAAGRRAEADGVLVELARSAMLAGPDELASWEARALEAQRLHTLLAEAEAELDLVGEGRSRDELALESEGVLRDEIGPRKREIDEELERLEEAIYAARREAESLEAGLELFGGTQGAESAQRLAELAAEIRDLSGTYARLRIARSVLSRELERFRDKNQGPILERASGLFARLTLGSFRGLRVGLDANVLECVRDGGQGLAVTDLSEGARYQLYFALRLASLERYLESGVCLPFVLDDVFIHWDDERARAGFELLGELAQRTQVLFFTHHAHLLELAERSLGPGKLRRHELGRGRANQLFPEAFH